METNYTRIFKREAVKKFHMRSKGQTLANIADSLKIPRSTLHGWIKKMDQGDLNSSSPSGGGGNEKSPYQWSFEERLNVLIGSNSLSGEDLGAYCREKGIFPHHLEAWKKEFIGLEKVGSCKDNRGEVKQLKGEIKGLQVELRRKEKALAEAAALLVLKKKVQKLWEEDEEL
jgi:hypothetical protein